ncbi:ABC transporter permease [Tenggerimyces flavus]
MMAAVTVSPSVVEHSRPRGLLSHSTFIAGRWLRAQLRQPLYIVFTLVQPAIWLLLFGQLFKNLAQLPGFGGGSYISYLTPGIVIMTALMGAGWSGSNFITDIDRGIMDRMLTSPVRRGALMIGQLVSQSAATVVQAVIVVLIGLLAGASYAGGVLGLLVTVLMGVLLGAAFASLSNAVALLARKQESLIAISQFVSLPLTFLSSVMMAPALMPSWLASVSKFNPVDWAVVASREALSASPDWSVVLTRGGLLLAFALVIGWLSTRAFAAYQRSA